nr:MAG TPA_asm: hypothetical protein [Bacteriophage sp.]
MESVIKPKSHSKWGGCSFAKFLSVHHNGVRFYYAHF